MIEKWLLAGTAVAVASWVAYRIRRRRKPAKWQGHEQPCRSYDPALDDEVKP